MGSAFSPKLANVFMSVILRSFLRTQVLHPLLMKHFIDDLIFYGQAIVLSPSLEQFPPKPSIHFSNLPPFQLTT